MVSRLARRSGVAVVQIAELLQWRPDIIYQVGVGLQHAECFIMRDECWPEVKIIGFEPNPTTYHEIFESYPGTLYPYALGNEVRDSVSFYQPDKHRDGSSLFRRAANDVAYLVPMSTLDTLFPDGPGYPNCLLWIDAEGNDLAVLDGAQKFLNGVQFINIEVTGTPSGPGWASPGVIQDWLNSRGFRCQWSHTQRIHVGQMDCIYVREELINPDICFCPCQIRGIPRKEHTGKYMLSFFEVVVSRDRSTTLKRGGRHISSDEEVVVK